MQASKIVNRAKRVSERGQPNGQQTLEPQPFLVLGAQAVRKAYCACGIRQGIRGMCHRPRLSLCVGQRLVLMFVFVHENTCLFWGSNGCCLATNHQSPKSAPLARYNWAPPSAAAPFPSPRRFRVVSRVMRSVRGAFGYRACAMAFDPFYLASPPFAWGDHKPAVPHCCFRANTRRL